MSNSVIITLIICTTLLAMFLIDEKCGGSKK